MKQSMKNILHLAESVVQNEKKKKHLYFSFV